MSYMLPKWKKGMMLLASFPFFFSVVEAQEADTTAWSIEMEDIVVTAQFAPTDSKSALHKVKTISLETIESRGIHNLEKLLEHELNIRLSQDMILGSSIDLQGMSGQNVKVMVDGVPVIGRVGDDIDISQIPLHNVERIEIIEGPLSVNYGTNALGGVINIITKRSQLKKFDLKMNSSLESTSEKQVDLSLGYRIIPGLLFRAEGSYFDFAGYNSQEIQDTLYRRTFQWNPKEKRNLSGLLRYNFGEDGQLSYRSSWFDETVENAGVIKRPKFKPYAFDEYYLTDRWDHSLFSESTIWSDYYLTGTLAFNHFRRRKEVLRVDFEEAMQTPQENEQDTSVFNAWVFRPVFASKFTSAILNFQVGADINFEEGFGRKIRDDSQEREGYSSLGDYALFTSVKYTPVKDLDLQLGLRVAKNTRFRAPVVPSFNMKYKLFDRFVIRGSYAKGFRAPGLKELFLYFVDSNHHIVGNPELEPELSDNFQLAMDWYIMEGRIDWNLEAGAFYNDIRSKIDLYDFVEVDGKYVPAATLGKSTTDFTYFNQDRFKSLGLNLSTSLDFDGLRAKLGVAPIGRYNQLPDGVSGVDPFSYVWESNADLSYKMEKWGMSFHFYIKHNNKLIRYFVDTDDNGNTFTNQRAYDGYYLADFNMVKSFWKKNIQLNLGVKNLFDVNNINYSDLDVPSGEISGQFPVAKGRKFHAGLIFHLQGN